MFLKGWGKFICIKNILHNVVYRSENAKNIGITIRPYNEISAPRLENYSCFVRLVLIKNLMHKNLEICLKNTVASFLHCYQLSPNQRYSI